MTLVDQLVSLGLAENNFAAAHIANNLKLAELPNDEARIERVRLYRRHRPLGSGKKFSKVDAIRETLAGREPMTLEAE